jgi:hypothetical protein
MNALSPIVLADAIEWQKPARRGERWPVALSTALHGALIVTALILLHPEPQALDLAGSSVEVELVATQTVTSNNDTTQSDAAVDMVSAGGEAVAPVASETIEAVEPVERDESEQAEVEPVEADTVEAVVETATPVLAAAVPAVAPDEMVASTTEALQPVEEAAPVPPPPPQRQQPAQGPKKPA